MSFSINKEYDIKSDFAEAFKCSVCLQLLRDPVDHIPCNNTFCKECMKTMEICPSCKNVIKIEEMKMSSQNMVLLLKKVVLSCKKL